jgi:hypothetical protein
MYAARYVGDAKALALPLVGGHIHDWNWLLGRWGWIDHCERIAVFLHGISSLVVIGAFVLAARLAFRTDADPLARGVFASRD